MSAPRLVVCGLEPGPAVALAAGALLAAFADERAVRPVLLGVDLPLWRLLYGASARTPRVLDPRLLDDAAAGELYDEWASGTDLTAVVAVEPALDRWDGVKGSRPLDVALALDAPLVLVVDARERGATVGAWACGIKLLARAVEFAGVIVVGGDEQGRAEGLRGLIEETAGLPVLGWVPPQLSEQFARQYGGAQGSLRQIGPQPVKGGEATLCREAATYLDRAGIEAAAARRGFLPARPRRLLAPLPAATGLKLAVAWGAPLEPFALEAIDLFKAQGLELEPFHLEKDEALPAGAAGLYVAGLLDEEQPQRVRRQRGAQDGHRGGASTAACLRWRWAAAPCCCSAASPTAADARTSSPGCCRARPSSSSGTTGRATCAPRPPARTPTCRGRRRCASSSTSSSSPCSRRRSRGGSAAGRRGRWRASSTSAAWRPRSSRPCPAVPDLAAGFVAAMRLAAPDA